MTLHDSDVDGVAASGVCKKMYASTMSKGRCRVIVDCQEATHRNYFGRLTSQDESTM
jgi:hypothetical protein